MIDEVWTKLGMSTPDLFWFEEFPVEESEYA